MRTYKIRLSENAENDFSFLEPAIATRIADKLDWFAAQENPLRFATHLTNSPYGTYRFRIGDYRAIFDIDSQGTITILIILRVKHRREVYD